jgi:hypothetical protein
MLGVATSYPITLSLPLLHWKPEMKLGGESLPPRLFKKYMKKVNNNKENLESFPLALL